MTATKTRRCIKVMMNPAGVHVVAWRKSLTSRAKRRGKHILYPKFHCDRTRVARWAEVCGVRKSLTVDMRVPAGHAHEPGSCPSKYYRHVENQIKYTTAHPATGPWRPRKDNASIMAVISAVLLECVRTPKKARWASVLTTGPNIHRFSIWKWWNHTPSSKSFTFNNARTTICINSQSTVIIATFTCYGTGFGKIWISGFWFW